MTSDNVEDNYDHNISEVDLLEEQYETLWNVLSEDEKLMMFCAIIRRLWVGEIAEPRSYRGILYDVFGFGKKSYIIGQAVGFLDIHNAITTKETMVTLFSEFKENYSGQLTEENYRKFLTDKNYK